MNRLISKAFAAGGMLLATQNVFSTPAHQLESPAAGAITSGIGLVRGWICDADQVTVSFNQGPEQTMVYGNLRPDTESVCGDADNGFELLNNWGHLKSGTNNIRVYADGVEIANHDFTVGNPGGGSSYLTGLSASYTLTDFPAVGETTNITWSEADQGFVIKSSTHTEAPEIPTPPPGSGTVTYGVPGNPGGFSRAWLAGRTLYVVIDVGDVAKFVFNANGTATVYSDSGSDFVYWMTIRWYVNETGGLWLQEEGDIYPHFESICDQSDRHILTEGYSHIDYGGGNEEGSNTNMLFFYNANVARTESFNTDWFLNTPSLCVDDRYDY